MRLNFQDNRKVHGENYFILVPEYREMRSLPEPIFI